MCGIFGYLAETPPDEQTMLRCLNTLEHRGPDQSGHYLDCETEYKLWMGHRRLSILDLSDAGKQPFVTPDKKVAVSVNGEIYNFQELRKELIARGAIFRSNSDSEVLLWGFFYEGEAYFSKLRGMYAAAIWDRRGNTPRLLLLRDRVGIKPLYYYGNGKQFSFASELKAIRALPDFSCEIDDFARDQFFVFGYIPAPLSIYRDVRKVCSGEYVVWESGSFSRHVYWKCEIPETKFSGSFEDAVDSLDHLVHDSVREQMISDVPLGSFLSGGIDSTLVTAIMQQERSSSVKTYTIGFESKNNDESGFSEEIASYLGTDHTTQIMGANDLFDLLPCMNRLYDEPFSDSSALPTLMLSRLARKQVTVALSGDGGDELFWGYNNLPNIRRFVFIDKVPYLLRRQVGASQRLPIPDKLKKLCKLIEYESFDEMYLLISGVFHRLYFKSLTGYDYVIHESEFHRIFQRLKQQINLKDITPYLDFCCYLPENILCKVDRASMSCALEVRPPLLDHRIAEFAFSLPAEYKYTQSGGKRILKELLGKYVPEKLWTRPKQGFSPPVGSWLKKELKEALTDYLSSRTLREEGLFQPDFVQTRLRDHLDGKKDNSVFLWVLFCWETWRKRK